ncbi:MAG: SDR family oxidoreductase [Chloroflexi bacterium]|nr:SDR family oxidoreductase [Chloroflexota bacterium]
MNLIVFGATGGTGKQLVEQALAAGNQVVAFVRNPSKLTTRHEHLTIVQGDLADQAAVERAIKGADAVISTLGPRGDSSNKPITRGTQNILAAMRKHGVRRFVLCATPSASDPNDGPDFKFKAMVTLVKLTMRPAYEEIVNVAAVVRASDCDWTIVRVPLLTDDPKSGHVKVGYLGKGVIGTRLARADMADFMLRQVQDTTYVRQAPAISN